MIKIATISGSAQENNNTEEPSRVVATRLVKYIVDTSCPDRSFEEMIRSR